MSIEDIKFSQMQTFGNHLYRRDGQIAEIIFKNTRTGIRKTIVDDRGMILRFPGIAHPDLVSMYSKGHLGHQIRYSSHISLLSGQYALIWQIQPDGRYWEDEDGFGGTSDDEIDLYAPLDESGNFAKPFRIFSIGSNKFYGTDEEEKLANALAMKEDPLRCLQRHVPDMLDEIKEKIKIPKSGSSWYHIPGTFYEAELTLDCEGIKWFVRAGMQKVKSDTSYVGYLKFLPLDEQREYLMTEQAKEDAVEELTQLFSIIQRKR